MAGPKKLAETLSHETTGTYQNPITTAALDSRPAKAIEKLTNVTAKANFEEGKAETPAKTVRKSRAEVMLNDYKVTELSLKDTMFVLQQIQMLLSAEHERLLGPHLQDMADRSKEESEKVAEAQKNKTSSLFSALGASASLAGALLMAMKLTSTALPGGIGHMIPAMLQVTEQGANPLVAGGGMLSALGQVSQSLSQAEQTKLQHIYKWTEERIRELDRVRNQVSQEKRQALQKYEQLLSELHRTVYEMLSRQQ